MGVMLVLKEYGGGLGIIFTGRIIYHVVRHLKWLIG